MNHRFFWYPKTLLALNILAVVGYLMYGISFNATFSTMDLVWFGLNVSGIWFYWVNN